MAQQQIDWTKLPDIDLKGLPDDIPAPKQEQSKEKSLTDKFWDSLKSTVGKYDRTGTIVPAIENLNKILPTLYGTDESALPPIRGVTRPYLPEINLSESNNLSSLVTGIPITHPHAKVAQFAYDNLIRPSSSIIGATTDFIGGKIISGGTGLIKSGAKLLRRGNINKVADNIVSKVDDVVDNVNLLPNTATKPTNLDPNFNQGMGNPELAGSVPYKPTTPELPTLPQDLRNAKPRYNMGSSSYTPQFESDLDKALYIISRPTPSKRDADYLKFVMEQTGLDELSARNLGAKIRNQLKDILKGQTDEFVKIPQLFKKEVAPNPIVAQNPNLPTRIKLKDLSPESINKAQEYGYRTTGELADDGSMIMTRELVDEIPTSPKIIMPNPKPDDILTPQMANPPNQPPIGLADELEDIPIFDESKASILTEMYNLPRGLLAAGDVSSAAWRQGKPLMLTKAWWNSWGSAFKSLGSEEAFKQSQKRLFNNPLVKPTKKFKKDGTPDLKVDGTPKLGKSLADKIGLHLTDLTSLSKREEAIASTWAEKVPLGVGKLTRATNRMYTTFLNELRVSSLESMLKDAKRMGLGDENNLPMMRDLASLVMDMTGRGKLSGTIAGKNISAERYGNLINSFLFSPRLAAAQVRLYNRWFNPASYWKENPVVRKEKLKGLLAVGGFWGTLATLGKIGGAQVSDNPTNADFGKIRIGDTRMDVAGGMQQYLVAASRLIQQESTSSQTGKTKEFGKGYNAPSMGKTIGNFAYNKLHPTMRFAVDLLTASDYKGTGEYGSMDLTSLNPMDNEITNKFIFLVAQDLYEIAQEQPDLLPWLALPVMSGAVSTQTYPKKKE